MLCSQERAKDSDGATRTSNATELIVDNKTAKAIPDAARQDIEKKIHKRALNDYSKLLIEKPQLDQTLQQATESKKDAQYSRKLEKELIPKS